MQLQVKAIRDFLKLVTKHSSENEMMLGESECRIYPYFKIQLAAQP